MAETGRPPIFESPEAMQQKIDEYITAMSSKVIKGEKEEDDEFDLGRPVTISGLAFYLGFESRQSFYDYEKRDGFSYIVKRARLFIENAYEERLLNKYPTGSIFALKNMGWADRSEIKHEGLPDQNITYQVTKTDE